MKQTVCNNEVFVLSGLNLEKMQGLSPGTKKTVRNNEVSVLSGCPDSKAQDSGFHKQNFLGLRNPDSLAWGDLFATKQRKGSA